MGSRFRGKGLRGKGLRGRIKGMDLICGIMGGMSGATHLGSAAVECRGLWKIFGARAEEAMAAVRERGLGKDDVLSEFGCVVGVADVSFSVRRGEIFCVMGLSGSGKSTLVRHINRLIEPTAGEVFIEGRSVTALDDRELRRLRSEAVGMVFQNMALLPHRTVRDNVAFALELRGADPRARREAADRVIAQVSLQGYGDRRPSELSGGMQQRVGLARALAADPDILLMDEPFSALDPLIRRQLQDQFLALSAKMRKTTVFITHDLDEAIRMGDRIAMMKDGRVAQIGSPAEIVSRPADDYVADFVRGVSKLNLILARDIMEVPPDNKQADAEWPRAAPDADLGELASLAADSPHPVAVMDGDRLAGTVTHRALLRAIRGEEKKR